MNEHDDRDLSAAFEALRAPASTADFEREHHSVGVSSRVSAWRPSQVLATVLAVLIGVAGAGTFLALRNATRGGVASSAGAPPARSGAAMAFDSTSGRTIMYGGVGADGHPLSDAWAWDGTAWTSLASPGPLAAASMSDDPADGGVLLLGLVATPPSTGSGGGCAVGSSASAVPAPVAPTSTAIPALGTGHVVPPVAPSPPLPGPTAPASGPPLPTVCVAPVPAAVSPVQTWVLRAGGWSRVGSAQVGGGVPLPNSRMAYDAASHEVIAVSSNPVLQCGSQVQGNASGAAIACPLAATTGSAGSAGSAGSTAPATGATLCPVPPTGTTCQPWAPSLSTWTWSHGRWAAATGAIVTDAASTVLVAASDDAHVTLITETPSPPVACYAISTCPDVIAPPRISVYHWAGDAWNEVSGGAAPDGFSLIGAQAASAGGRTVALIGTGQVYAWSAASSAWTLASVGQDPSGRTAVALAEGPHGSVVLFGGLRLLSTTSARGVSARPGGDTWVLDAGSWRHAGGPTPPPVTVATPCSDVGTLGNPCMKPGVPRAIGGAPPPSPT